MLTDGTFLDLSENILWPFATLWSLPVDVLIRYLDITSLAVNAAVKR